MRASSCYRVSVSGCHPETKRRMGGIKVFFALIGTIVCEYLISGIISIFNPRLDILLLIFTHGRNIAPSPFFMFCAGILKDCLYFTPWGYSSVLCVVANEVLFIFKDKLKDWRWLLFTVALINISQWGMGSVMSLKITPASCLVPEIAISFVGGLILHKR